MAFEFTSSGLTIQTYSEIFEEIADGLKAIYGADINLDAESPDGQRVATIAQGFYNLQQALLDLYNGFDPDLSTGDQLTRVCKLAGVFRRPATKSTWNVNVTTTQSVTLPIGYQIEDSLGQTWSTTASVTIDTTTTAVTFTADDWGEVEPGDATETPTAATILAGVSTLLGLTVAVGQAEETDAELRVKRARSVQLPGQTTKGALLAALLNAPGVTDAAVEENYTAATDSNGIPAHSIGVTVEGGTVADIAEIIAKHRGDAGLYGVSGLEVDTTYDEVITLDDGSTITIEHEITYNTPGTVTVDVDVEIEAIGGQALGDAATLIKDAIEARGLKLNESIAVSELYAVAYGAVAQGLLSVNTIEVSVGGSPAITEGEMRADWYRKADFSATVTEA